MWIKFNFRLFGNGDKPCTNGDCDGETALPSLLLDGEGIQRSKIQF